MRILKQSEINNLLQLYQSGQLYLAEQKAKKLLDEFPQELILHNILGVSQEAQKKFKEAADSYRNALKIQPQFAEMHFNLGSVLYQLGDNQSAIQHYQKAVHIKPDLVMCLLPLPTILVGINAGKFLSQRQVVLVASCPNCHGWMI